jgi:putative peptidoglycan lipid II flippase
MGHTALVAATTSLAAKGMAFIKEVVVASVFGLSGALDIYLVAFVLIGVPLNVLLNAVQTALITHLAGANLASNEEASRFVVTSLMTLACLAVLLPIWLWALPYALPWLASGFSAEKRQALETALHWLIPYYFLTGFNLLGYGVLQAKGRYLANGLLPSATPIVIILVLLFVWGGQRDWKALAEALVIGSAIESLLLLVTLYRHGQIALPHRLDIKGMNMIMTSSLALLPGTVMLTVSPVVEQAIAAAMGEGSNAALAYGYKLPSALQGIIVTAIGITALPYFAKQLGQGQSAYCLHSLNKLSFWLMVGGAVLILPLSFFSSDIVALLYQRGSFDALATIRVAPIQFAYFMQIPFALVAMLGIKVMAALKHNWLTSVYTATAVLVQAAVAYELSMNFGTQGIAWAATSVSALLAATSFLTARKTLSKLSQ